MKIANQRNFVATDGVMETKQFNLVFNAKIAQILSDGIYTDKIRAIIRELSTNGYDSHVMAKNTARPIEVHLPTAFSKEFYIRDYGIGLSPEQVENIYTSYGASDKEDSNEFTGCLGLGSKVPFCYHTRTAQVESFYNGTHYIYSMYLNEKGLPALSKIAEVPTTEPNGVKITLSVHSNHLNEFAEKAKDVYTYFKTRPKFFGNVVSIPKIDYVMQDTLWSLREQKYGNYGKQTAKAIMGNIAYEVNLTDNNLTQTQKELLACPLDMYFEIGDLDIVASREGLSFNPRTKNAVLNRLNLISQEISNKIGQSISTAKCQWDARVLLQQAKDNIPLSLFNAIVSSGVQFQGKNINLDSIQLDSNKLAFYKKYTTIGSKMKSSSTSYITPDKNILFYEDDIQKTAVGRVREFLLKNNDKAIYLFRFDTPAQKQDLLDKIGLNTIESVGSLPKPVAASRKNTRVVNGVSVKTTPVMQWAPSQKKQLSWIQSNVDLVNDSGIYVEFSSWSCKVQGDDFVHPNMVSTCNALLQKCNFKYPQFIYGIKSNLITKLNTNWKSYRDYVVDLVTPKLTNLNKDDYDTIKELSKQLYLYRDNRYQFSFEDLTKVYNEVKKINPSYQGEFSKNYEILAKIHEMSEDFAKSESIMELAKMFKVTTTGSKPTVVASNVLKAEDTIYKKYPLFVHLRNVNEVTHVAKYILSV